MTDFVRFQAEDGVALVTLDSPATRNALLSAREYGAIADACSRIASDRAIRVAVLTGAGPAFCAGGNVKEMAERARAMAHEAVEDRYAYKDGIHRIARALLDLEVPCIAAVNGPAIGAGLDLACMCDIRIAGASARFAESFVRLGIIPGDGGAWLLQRIVGFAHAAEMTFTGETIDAERALAIGLVSRVVADGELAAEALSLARRIADNPGHALRMAKRLMREAQTVSFDTVLEMSAAFQALAHATGDHGERIGRAAGQLGKGKS
jgi:enoyl-CoA hydratase/carnithine racemase